MAHRAAMGVPHRHPLALEAFAFVRHLMLNGALSEAVATLSAILAGSSFATDAL